MHVEIFGLNYRWVSSVLGIAKILSYTAFECIRVERFECIRAERFDDLTPPEFLSVCFKYDYYQ